MGGALSSNSASTPNGHPAELGYFIGLGDYIAEDKKTTPIFLLQGNQEDKAANVAIAGGSGVGKSLLVNTLRGVKPGEPGSAPVGVTETTREPVWYTFQEGSAVRLWDMEGAGSSCCSWKDYTGTVGLRYFDAVLLLSANRLTELDVEIISEMELNSVPLFVVRTKLDKDLRNNFVDLDMSAEETMESIRNDLQSQGVEDCYLINARQQLEFDFPRLVEDLAVRLEFFDGPPKEDGMKEEGVDGTDKDLQPATGPELAEGFELPKMPDGSEIPGLKEVPKEIVAAWVDLEAKSGQDAAKHAWSIVKPPEHVITPTGEVDFEKGEMEPLDNLVGHWVYKADVHMYEYFENEMGSILAYGMVKLSGPPEHTYWKNDQGHWACRMKNYWTNMISNFVKPETWTAWIDPKNEVSPLTLMVIGNRKFMGQSRDWIEGETLCSEQFGKAMKFDGRRKKEKFHYKLTRYVSGGRYWVDLENLETGNKGTRVFTRHPYYKIHNKTEKVVTLKTYAIGASFWRSATSTLEIQPGVQLVDTSAVDSQPEQAFFTLPNRSAFSLPKVTPYGEYTLEKSDFK